MRDLYPYTRQTGSGDWKHRIVFQIIPRGDRSPKAGPDASSRRRAAAPPRRRAAAFENSQLPNKFLRIFAVSRLTLVYGLGWRHGSPRLENQPKDKEMIMKKIEQTKLLKSVQGLIAAAIVVALPAMAGAASEDFVVLDNPGDPNFNQLLGINDARIIVGYFGDGTVVANNGYVLVPRNHYSVENFTHLPAGDRASQTQAIGINNNEKSPKIVGFYTDSATGVTHGFLDAKGTQMAVDDPQGSAPHVAAPVQNLLGVNDRDEAAGFWVDNNGNEHGFVAQLDESTMKLAFTEVPPSLFKGAVATQVSNINDEHVVCGFWTDANKVSHGFVGVLGRRYLSFEAEIDGMKVMSTQVFGCNNNGGIVGQATDSAGALHGFVYEEGRFRQFDAPGSSQVPEFGVQGTLINGINDFGDIVGFFSDGVSKVKSFVRYAEE
jgi:hypothetical protein